MAQTALVVSGASGQLGRRVVELLLEGGAGNVIATTRYPEKLRELAARGVNVRKGTFDEPEALAEAFAGGGKLLLISTDVVDAGGRRPKQHRQAIESARKAGIEHIVYTSLINPGPESPVTIAPDHYATEEALDASGLEWTILRNGIYADNLLHVLPVAIATGELVSAAGNGKAAYVTREDCARVAAAVLSSPRAGHTKVDVTGPELVTHDDIARLASDIVRRQISYAAVESGTLRTQYLAAGLPPLIADMAVSFDVAVARGTFDVLSNAVVELTGRPATKLAQFLMAHRSALMMSPAA